MAGWARRMEKALIVSFLFDIIGIQLMSFLWAKNRHLEIEEKKRYGSKIRCERMRNNESDIERVEKKRRELNEKKN